MCNFKTYHFMMTYIGTIRFNLDPFGKYDDAQLIKSLKLSHLWDVVVEMAERKQQEIDETKNENDDSESVENDEPVR